MENNTKQIEQLKEMRDLLNQALEISNQLGTTSKGATLRRMIEVIRFDLFKLGVTN